MQYEYKNWKYTKFVWGEDQELTAEALEECDCEHCGVLEPYDLIINDGCTTYCQNCMNANDALPEEPMLKEAIEYSLKQKIEYFKERIKLVEQEMEKL